ncbi:unnamed protein product [Ilex paraguariensis]|uniref:Josephin-like protein n=1 Tax=Ilex paraguariensis TaxID=185542 RepID=A0ABC8QU98_9AQUA
MISIMSRKLSRRVTFSPDINEIKPTVIHKHGGGIKVGGNKKRVISIWSYRVPKSYGFSPVNLLKSVGAKVARALRSMSTRRRSSRRVSSSSLVRSRSYAEPLDSHRAEAMEDCIEFLNSSSSLKRSSSFSTSSC